MGTTDALPPVLQALRVLAGEFLAQHPSYKERVVRALLAHLLLLPTSGKCAVTALKMAKKADHPLLQGAPDPARMQVPAGRAAGSSNAQLLVPACRAARSALACFCRN